jgi:ProP effector
MTDITITCRGSNREKFHALAELYPQCFARKHHHQHHPLKLKIQQDLKAAGVFGGSTRKINGALTHYCKRDAYRESVKAGAIRIDLQGEPAGVVTIEEAAHTASKLAAKRAAIAARAKSTTVANAQKAAAPAAITTVINTEPPPPAPSPAPPKPLSIAGLKAAAAARKAPDELRGRGVV